jgi:uncharacterized protein (TIGR02266 family)
MKNLIKRDRSRRISIKIPVTYSNLEMFLDNEIMNLGKGGVFIKADISMPLRSHIDFQFTLPGEARIIKATGIVVWSRQRGKTNDGPSGMGIQFLDISTADIEAILDYIERLIKEG